MGINFDIIYVRSGEHDFCIENHNNIDFMERGEIS